MRTLYDRDFYDWLAQQTSLLRERRFAEIDLDNVIEELDSLRVNQKTHIRRGVRHALIYLTLCKVCPNTVHDAEWYSELVEAKIDACVPVEISPSLAPFMKQAFAAEWPRARAMAAMRLRHLGYSNLVPHECLFNINEIFGTLQLDYDSDE